MLTVTTILVFLMLCMTVVDVKKPDKSKLIEQTTDLKEYKKLLRTRNNVLTVFVSKEDYIRPHIQLYGEVAEAIRGLGTIILVDCSNAKKLCKKFKVSPVDITLKHFKDGEFHKDYDRMNTFKSLKNFMLDPTGDLPWDEDVTANDVVHLENRQAFNKLIKQNKPTLVMFYAPWCGHCKRLKPEYAKAATDLLDEGMVLAAMDLNIPDNNDVKAQFNITGFPTLLYFKNEKEQMKYGGENTHEGLVKWMKNPTEWKEPEVEKPWSEEAVDVIHLLDDTFDDYISTHPSVLVMFYAPWCGHCKKMKPEYVDAAQQLNEQNMPGVLAAVDATIAKQLAERFGVKGYPTVKYFMDGEVKDWELSVRTSDAIITFMENPEEPPPPPPPEPTWEETEDRVLHLNDENFRNVIKKKKHTLVMFYAPWCGHCKKAKPEFVNAALKFQDNIKVAFAGIDCTINRDICGQFDVTGYPTFIYFNYGRNHLKYSGGREENDFVTFMTDPLNTLSSTLPLEVPEPHDTWADVDGAEFLNHPSEAAFDVFIKEHKSVLVMFYAPWCGHCKAMKHDFGEAAKILSEKGEHFLAAVDGTLAKALLSQYKVTGYPTLKYFKDGEFFSDYDKERTAKDIVAFLQPSDNSDTASSSSSFVPSTWSDDVIHLHPQNFKETLSKYHQVFIMFYTPWCTQCKTAQPEYSKAAQLVHADKVKEGGMQGVAAIDCKEYSNICKSEEVKGYPIFKLYEKEKFKVQYSGEHKSRDYVTFLRQQNIQGARKTEL